MSKIAYFTQEGYDKIAEELEDLKTRGRAEAAKAIAEAREKGDLSENAEYDAAKDAQGMLEMKIHGLESSIANAQIIDSSKVDTSQVSILTKVKIKNLKVNREMQYQIVSESEADLKAKKLSIDSPIGKGLVGKKIGDIADIHTLVVPKREVDKLFDLDAESYAELFTFARKVAQAIEKEFDCNRCGMAVIGLEVPHAHIHLIPINSLSDMTFGPGLSLETEEFQEIAERIGRNL